MIPKTGSLRTGVPLSQAALPSQYTGMTGQAEGILSENELGSKSTRLVPTRIVQQDSMSEKPRAYRCTCEIFFRHGAIIRASHAAKKYAARGGHSSGRKYVGSRQYSVIHQHLRCAKIGTASFMRKKLSSSKLHEGHIDNNFLK